MFYIRKLVYLIVLIGYSASNAGSYDDFFHAVELDGAREVRALLLRGFDPNAVSPDGQFALILALRRDSFGVARVLIAHPDTRVEVRTDKDESPLMLAAIKGQLELCRLLIERDADVNKPGWAPLHYAASAGDIPVLRLLLDNYAYIDAESPNGSTPLMMAARYGSAEAVRVLLDAGADPTLRNSLGLSALDFAQQGQRGDTARLIGAAMRARGAAGAW